MGLNYTDLDAETRFHMHAELTADIEAGRTYPSKRFTARGHATYRDALLAAIATGNDDSLAEHLRREGAFAAQETYERNGKTFVKDVPFDAHITYAEGEFNRYYIRGVCMRALDGGHAIEVIRAKEVEKPRSASLALIGTRPDAAQLLEALRTSERVDVAFGIPNGPNSGLSVKLLVGVPA